MKIRPNILSLTSLLLILWGITMYFTANPKEVEVLGLDRAGLVIAIVGLAGLGLDWIMRRYTRHLEPVRRIWIRNGIGAAVIVVVISIIYLISVNE